MGGLFLQVVQIPFHILKIVIKLVREWSIIHENKGVVKVMFQNTYQDLSK